MQKKCKVCTNEANSGAVLTRQTPDQVGYDTDSVLFMILLCCISCDVCHGVMAHLHCSTWTRIATQTMIPVLYRNK